VALPGGRIGIAIFVWARALNLKAFRIFARKSRRFEFGAKMGCFKQSFHLCDHGLHCKRRTFGQRLTGDRKAKQIIRGGV
jgi:hypothetical protein